MIVPPKTQKVEHDSELCGLDFYGAIYCEACRIEQRQEQQRRERREQLRLARESVTPFMRMLRYGRRIRREFDSVLGALKRLEAV